jgi:hypothetical protein
MRLIQIEGKYAKSAIIQSFFVFQSVPGTTILMHLIDVDGHRIGWVATEQIGAVGGPHIFIKERYRTPEFLEKAEWLFRHVYCKLMKALDMTYLVTNCDQEDDGTIRFMQRCGFKLKPIMVAEYTL